MAYASARDEFFHWALKWFYTPQEVTPHSETPQFPVLISLLQAAGFELKLMEILPGNEVENRSANYNVSIKCPCSHAQALLTSINSVCKQEKHGSCLVPEIPAGIAKFTREILSYLIKVLNESSSEVNPCPEEANDAPHALRSLDTIPCMHQKPINNTAPPDDVGMDVDVLPSTSQTSEQQTQSSPLLGGNPRMTFERQKTWSFADLDDLRASSAPPHTSSPISVCDENADILGRLHEITSQLQDLMKDVSKNKVSRQHASAEMNFKVKQKPQLTETKHTAKTLSLQHSDPIKRFNSPVSRVPIADRKDTPASRRNTGISHMTVMKTQKAGSLINLSDCHTRSPRNVKTRTNSTSSTSRKAKDPSKKTEIPKLTAHSVNNLHSAVVESERINSNNTSKRGTTSYQRLNKETSKSTKSLKTPSFINRLTK